MCVNFVHWATSSGDKIHTWYSGDFVFWTPRICALFFWWLHIPITLWGATVVPLSAQVVWGRLTPAENLVLEYMMLAYSNLLFVMCIFPVICTVSGTYYAFKITLLILGRQQDAYSVPITFLWRKIESKSNISLLRIVRRSSIVHYFYMCNRESCLSYTEAEKQLYICFSLHVGESNLFSA